MIAFKEQIPVKTDFDRQDPGSIMRWAVRTVEPGELAVATSFGPAGMVNLHLMSKIAPDVPVIFVDTLYHFAETLALAERAVDRYGINLKVYRPAESREAFEKVHGPRLWETDLDEFHRLTKVEPMQRALEEEGVSAWITGRRRDQASTRAEMPVVEPNGSRLKINPLAEWTRDDVWQFIRLNDIPYNALHDRGYASVGDAPLTTPVREGEDERAGRWRGQDRTECGLHTMV